MFVIPVKYNVRSINKILMLFRYAYDLYVLCVHAAQPTHSKLIYPKNQNVLDDARTKKQK